MNKYQNITDTHEIMDLVKLLRQNGDKVLSASSKLSLSTMLLYNLNEALSLIVDESKDLDSSFQVCNSSTIDIFHELKFLYDFVQKTVGLKIISCQNNPNIPVDITKFRHLKFLELKKIRIDLIKGLQRVRGQLESVICAGKKGVSTVSQLLATCGGDAGIGFVWGSLKYLALPHNALECLDSSFELVPWLQILDLSHNLIITANELACLANLKYVNLGYNKLEAIPTFNKAASHSLQVLVLRNNYIENINGLQILECLTELDLSYNCLAEHSALWPLERMSTLSWLSLKGNPISYHPKHRSQTIKYLNSCLSDSKFVLDHLLLSKSERLMIAQNQLFYSIRSEPSRFRDSLASLSSSNSNYLSASVNVSINSEYSDKQMSTEVTTTTGDINGEKRVSKTRKKLNVKEAIITEDEHEKKDCQLGSTTLSSSYLETSQDHLETKKQILALRQQFGGEHWLSSHAGTFIQDIMGLQSSSYTDLTSLLTYECSDANTVSHTSDSITQSDKSIHDETIENVGILTEESAIDNQEEEPSVVVQDEEADEGISLISEVLQTDTSAYQPPYDPEDETGDLYLVQQKTSNDELEELFLIITEDNIKERDGITGKVKYSWSMSSVLSCVLGRSEPITVDIIFDTARKDRENRRYIVELEDARKIVSTIDEKIKKRPILLKVFKCLKCSTQFSQDSEYLTMMTISHLSGPKQLKCPTCESTLVVEIDDLSTIDTESTEDSGKLKNHREEQLETTPTTNLQHSESYSSIGSATSLEESRESTPSTTTFNKKYESDIEILSNPSQSSIEVLEDTVKKRVSEDRSTAVASSVLTMPDTTPAVTGLTESSSSGSLTDSICTAYENRSAKQNNPDEKSQHNNSNKDVKLTPVANLTSMLGGLLQSIKISGNKPMLMKTEDVARYLSTNIQYSYTDFSSVDHRIKLHVILNIFEHKNEELVLLLRADILMHTTKDTFPGCLVLSTSKLYILRIDGTEGEDPQRWLHKEFCCTMDRLRSFAPLPFKQGMLIELQQSNNANGEYSTSTFACILQDFQRTSNFLLYITDLSLPANCDIKFIVPEHCTSLMHDLLQNAENYQDGDAVRLLAVFSCAVLKCENQNIQLKISSLIVTASLLLILNDNMEWLLPSCKEPPGIKKQQVMSNLVAIEHDGTTIALNFLDEVASVEETWILEFVSVSAAEAVINSVQPPWEELFSIPLQITTLKTVQKSM